MIIREITALANMDGFGLPNPISGVLFGGEDQAHKFIIRREDGTAFAGTVTAKFLRYADDVTVPLTGSIEDGAATVTLIENCYMRPGRFKLTVYVTQGESTTAVYCCMGTVDRTDGQRTVDPGSEITLDVTDLINQINTATASVPADYTALLATIAPTFIASTAYTAGQYVWYNGTLYRFTADHAAGTWTGTDATAAVVGEDIRELKSVVKAFEKEFVADDFVVNGGITGSTGNTTSGTTRLTSDYFTAAQRFSARTLNDYLFYVFAWDGETYIGSYRNGSYVKGVGAQAMSEFYFTSYPATYRFRICVKRPNGGEISLSEKTNVLFTDNILGPDKTLSVEGKAADAAAVGQGLSDLTEKIFSALSNDAQTINATEANHADLNNYTTPGNYKVISVETAQYVDNAPTQAYSYRLFVSQTTNTQRLYQIAFINSSNHSFAVRIFTNNTWYGWQILANATDVETIDTALAELEGSFVGIKQRLDDNLQWAYNEHFYRIPISADTQIRTYNIEDGSVVPGDEVAGTDYIKCPKYLVTKTGGTIVEDRVNVFTQYGTAESSATRNGVTFTLSDDGETYALNGTALSNAAYVKLMSAADSRQYMHAGDTYYLDINTDARIIVYIYWSDGSTLDYDNPTRISETTTIELPDSFAGCLIRIYALNGSSYNNNTVRVRLLTQANYTEATASNIYLYFYNKNGLGEYVRNDDILYVETSTDKINNFTTSTLANKVIEVPDNTYMQVGAVANGNVELYGWDGVHIGAEMCGNCYDISPYNGGTTCVVIPGEAKMVFSKSFAVSTVYGKPQGYDGREEVYSVNSGAYRMCIPLPTGYDYFLVPFKAIEPINKNTKNPTPVDAVYNGNLNDEIVAICETDYEASGVSRANRVVEVADVLARETPWTCKKETKAYAGLYKFYEGVKYSGVPYVNRWITPSFLGFHVTRHTFINAANDEDSLFYTEHSTTSSGETDRTPGYGLVCSSFAELCSGWPYPMVTGNLQLNPDNVVIPTNNPIPGTIMHNGGGHCFIPDVVLRSGNNKQIAVYEETNPQATRLLRMTNRRNLDFFSSESESFRYYEYLHNYIYAIYNKGARGYPKALYDIYSGAITNGSARPYGGDRCVFTNVTGVKINIKDDNASTLYLQKCTFHAGTASVSPTNSVNGYFTDTEDEPIAISITSEQMVIDTNVLEDGSYYGCYTNTDNTKEYFEYHSVVSGTYQKSNNNYVFDIPPFWYVSFAKGIEQHTNKAMYIAIPYVEDGDYSRYYAAMNPAEGLNAVAFYKGALGAYIAPLTQRTL